MPDLVELLAEMKSTEKVYYLPRSITKMSLGKKICFSRNQNVIQYSQKEIQTNHVNKFNLKVAERLLEHDSGRLKKVKNLQKTVTIVENVQNSK